MSDSVGSMVAPTACDSDSGGLAKGQLWHFFLYIFYKQYSCANASTLIWQKTANVMSDWIKAPLKSSVPPAAVPSCRAAFFLPVLLHLCTDLKEQRYTKKLPQTALSYDEQKPLIRVKVSCKIKLSHWEHSSSCSPTLRGRAIIKHLFAEIKCECIKIITGKEQWQWGGCSP